jgi:hypothetical protein
VRFILNRHTISSFRAPDGPLQQLGVVERAKEISIETTLFRDKARDGRETGSTGRIRVPIGCYGLKHVQAPSLRRLVRLHALNPFRTRYVGAPATIFEPERAT